MGAKKLITGERYSPINPKVYRKFKRETKIDIDFDTFRNIIWTTNQEIADNIADEESGVELPERLGHIVVSKFKASGRPIDWMATKKTGVLVPYLNLHSFGFMFEIRWFTTNCSFKNKQVYKYKSARHLARKVSSRAKEGKIYHKWEDTDFWSETRLQRSFSKFYRTHGDNQPG